MGEWLDEMAMVERILDPLSGVDHEMADVQRCFGVVVRDAIKRLEGALEVVDLDPSSARDHRTSLGRLDEVYKNLVDFLRHEGYWNMTAGGPAEALEKQRPSKRRIRG
jgi:hypothetical protein